jgi:hypothetical protein
MYKYLILIVIIISAVYVFWPKLCSTNGFWGYECSCLGYETEVRHEFTGAENEGTLQSFCFGYRRELLIRE